jgi:hypothetical protein
MSHCTQIAVAKPQYEVRRYMQNGGWAVVYRGPDLSKAATVRDAMERTVGLRAPVDLVEVSDVSAAN